MILWENIKTKKGKLLFYILLLLINVAVYFGGFVILYFIYIYFLGWYLIINHPWLQWGEFIFSPFSIGKDLLSANNCFFDEGKIYCRFDTEGKWIFMIWFIGTVIIIVVSVFGFVYHWLNKIWKAKETCSMNFSR